MSQENMRSQEKRRGQERIDTSNPFACVAPEAMYIHVPFCESKCRYCNFYSIKANQAERAGYVDLLLLELSERERELKASGVAKRPLRSIYFGGGTPSILSPGEVEKILLEIAGHWSLASDIEITLEANPGSDFVKKAGSFKQLGINRLSLGLQTTDNQKLAALGRRHTRQDFACSLEAAYRANFTNVSLDLMLGLLGESLYSFQENVELALAYKTPHISFYSLQIEEGTALANQVRANPDLVPEEAEERKMYHYLMERLEAEGLLPYEISNAAKPGFESRHNCVYWRAEPYYGLGPSASSYVFGLRASNLADYKAWAEAISTGNFAGACVIEEDVDGTSARKEFMMLGFRLLAGISKEKYRSLFEEEMDERFSAELALLLKKNFIEARPEGYRLTALGLDYANRVFGEFI